MPSRLKQLLLGRPLANEAAAHQRLSNPVALAVFSSDALSSVAYATEEILLALIVAGSAPLALSLPISIGIGVLLLIVAASYRQTIKAYPCGGGAYIVAKENLGTLPGLVAGASLLIDYVLTVAVSVSSGTAAVTSAFPTLQPYRVEIAAALVIALVVANLRGVKESGAAFAGPTFFFVGMLGLLIVVGLYKYLTGDVAAVSQVAVQASSDLTLFILLKAFASGCTAMTGVEAIANGVQAFREPAADNARKTLTWMAGILLFLFVGTSLLGTLTGVVPSHTETVLSQIARGAFGTSVLYYLLQAATAAILVLAANTSYADFPRLGSIMASDGFLPKQLKERGSRLVYSNGMLLLTAVSIALIVLFRGETHRLIPLYAVGVFTSFTLSQAGMVMHWRRLKGEGWQWSMVMNGLGAVATLVVLLVIAYAKFTAGAWMVLLLIPALVAYLWRVKRHYDRAAEAVALTPQEAVDLDKDTPVPLSNHVVLLISGIDRKLARAIQYVRALKSDSCEAVFIDVNGDAGERIAAEWARHDFGLGLTVLPSPFREIVDPLRDYVRSIPRPDHDHVVTVVVSEFVPSNPNDLVLHEQTSFWIKNMLFNEPGVVICDVPYHPEEYAAEV